MIWISYSTISIWVVLVGMIVHGHGNVKFAHHALDLHPVDSNHTIGSFAKLCLTLRKCLHTLQIIMKNDRSIPLYEAVLDGKDVCLDLLSKFPSEPLFVKELPVLCRSNWTTTPRTIKQICVRLFVFVGCDLGIFKEVFISFLLVGYMHNHM